MTDKLYPAIRHMSGKVAEADTLIFLHVLHISFINVRRHGLITKCLNIYILLLMDTNSAYIWKYIK